MEMDVAIRKAAYGDKDLEGQVYQIIGGVIVMAPSASTFHQEIIRNILDLLSPFVRAKSLGKLLLSPIDFRFSDDEVYQPDLAFIRHSKLNQVTKDRVETLPDLVVEVLSPSNAYYDLTHKKAIYAQYGVAEYWIVDPIEETVEILLNENGLYRTDQLLRKQGMLTSAMFPGFSMKVEDVFAF